MLTFLKRPRLKQHVYKTRRGIECPMFHREGTSDWNTLMSALEQDEYHLNDYGLKPGDIAVDIGSHIGGVTVLLATLGLRVYSIEALPENASLQKKNLSLNKKQEQVLILNKAISGSSGGKTRLYYGDVNEEQGKHHEFIGTSVEFKHFFGKGRYVEVAKISIDEIFKKYGISHCRLLKIDVEGAEWEALAGVSDEILGRIDILLGEWHAFGENRKRENLLKLLRGRFRDVSDGYHAPPNDFVFVRKDDSH